MKALLRGETQNYLELACDYQNMGLWDDAINVLKRFLRMSPKNVDPMIHYTLGYYWERQGDAGKAGNIIASGKRCRPITASPSGSSPSASSEAR